MQSTALTPASWSTPKFPVTMARSIPGDLGDGERRDVRFSFLPRAA
jgi:hypothetical protein